MLLPEFIGMIGGNGEKVKREEVVSLFKTGLVLILPLGRWESHSFVKRF